MRIKLKNKTTGHIKYITKPDGYQISINDELRLKRWKHNDDVWLVIKILADSK